MESGPYLSNPLFKTNMCFRTLSSNMRRIQVTYRKPSIDIINAVFLKRFVPLLRKSPMLKSSMTLVYRAEWSCSTMLKISNTIAEATDTLSPCLSIPWSSSCVSPYTLLLSVSRGHCSESAGMHSRDVILLSTSDNK